MQLSYNGKRQEEDENEHDHADGACDGVVIIGADTMPTPGAIVLPEIFYRGTLKSQDDEVDNHPDGGEISSSPRGSLQPGEGEDADV